MKYKVKKDNIVFEVDDTILLVKQPIEFQEAFNEGLDENNMAEFDNATLLLMPSGRVLINSKEK